VKPSRLSQYSASRSAYRSSRQGTKVLSTGSVLQRAWQAYQVVLKLWQRRLGMPHWQEACSRWQ
jgi:hypothetical protein